MGVRTIKAPETLHAPGRVEARGARMRQQLTVFLLCLLCLAVTSCVSKKQYAQMEAGLMQQLERERQKQRGTEAELLEAKRSVDQCRRELSDLQPIYSKLQSRCADLERQNMALADKLDQLSHQTTALQSDVEERETILDLQKKIAEQLRDQIAAQDVKIEAIESKLKVTFVDKILFRSGSAMINTQGKQSLRKVAAAIRGDTEHMIEVQGHTDNVAISPRLQNVFPTNWELSTARATAVVRFLQDEGGIDPQRLSASGFSFYQPVAKNDTEAGRRQNRRIDIILVPIP